MEDGSEDRADRVTAKKRPSKAVVADRAAPTALIPKHAQVRNRRHAEATRTYGRGNQIDTKGVKDKKLRRNLTTLETKFRDAALKAKDAEVLHENTSGFLEPENELERTYKVRQDEILANIPIENAQKRFDLKLDVLGPYVHQYTRNGRELLLAGRKGHVATMDWREGKLGCELQLAETVRDARWLHNNQYFALAQKRNVYIYDRNGVELHCMRKLMDVTHLEFLPYHFLLGALTSAGFLKYLDVSVGNIVCEIPTRLGPPVSLCQNPWNAILHVGHQNGSVTLWSPNSTTPLVKLLAHRGPVRSLAVDREGRYMVSTGQDLKMAVWDIRQYKQVHSYNTRHPGSSVSISDNGLTAVSYHTSVTIWKDLFSQERVKSPYMAWGGEGKRIESVRWCPYDDVLGLGTDKGFSSIIVPGAGEAQYDAMEVNPYETAKQRQEAEVKSLLNKLPPEMIALDPNFIGKLDLRSEAQRQADKDLDAPAVDVAEQIRNKSRGRNSALKKYLRKQRKRNVIDEKRLKVEELWKEQQEKSDKRKKEAEAQLGPALSRFVRKE